MRLNLSVFHKQAFAFIPWTCQLRSLSNAPTSNLAALRKRTGLAFTLCKKALELHENDLDKAEVWLKEEEIRHGYQRAAKIKTRKAAQGLISLFLDSSASKAVMLELNCETDFVAKNEKFRELGANIARSLFKADQIKSTHNHTNTIVNHYRLHGDNLSYFDDDISGAITHLQENIKISRALLSQKEPHHDDVLLYGTTHAAGDTIPDLNGVQFGKYGAIVALKKLSDEETEKCKLKVEKLVASPPPELATLKKSEEQSESEPRQLTDQEIDDGVGEEESDIEDEVDMNSISKSDACRILCQHIIGYKPLNLKKTDQMLAKEAELRGQGYKIPVETDCLLDQKIIINDSLTVSDFMGSHGFEVIDFIRYECGEQLDE